MDREPLLSTEEPWEGGEASVRARRGIVTVGQLLRDHSSHVSVNYEVPYF